MPSRLYHNPRCSKSREALALLRTRGVEPELVLYLEAPPDAAALERLAAKLEGGPAALLRSAEPEAADIADDAPTHVLAAVIAATPRLLQRPIFEHGDRAIVGRPPERVLELL